MTSAAEKYTILLRKICELIGSVTGKRDFSTSDHIRKIKEERWDGKKYWDDVNDQNSGELSAAKSFQAADQIGSLKSPFKLYLVCRTKVMAALHKTIPLSCGLSPCPLALWQAAST